MSDHILIIDDEQPLIDLMRVLLRPLSRTIESATSGADAIQFAQVDPPAVVVLDLMLPDMSGFEICRVLKEMHPKLPVIICTALHDSAAEEQAQKVGASFFLRKPVSRAVICETVNKALENRQ